MNRLFLWKLAILAVTQMLLAAARPSRATSRGGFKPPLAEAASSRPRLFRRHESPETAVSGAIG